MKKYLYSAVVFLLISMSGIHAQRVRHVKAIGFGKNISGAPLELVKIPSGTYVRPVNGVFNAFDNNRRTVLISDFYISTREVTNIQYKEFIDWVRDSIAAYLLGGNYLNVDRRTGETTINWRYAAKIDYSNPKIQQKLAPIMLDATKTLSHRPEIDPNKLVYSIQGIDYQEAAKPENQGHSPSEFMYQYDVKIYPDTLVWVRDFGYSNNMQLALGYFSGEKYKNYPVVGVTWIQANAYCDWFEKQKINKEQSQKKLSVGGICRLPTEMEWAYASNLNNVEATSSNKNKTVENTSSYVVTPNYATPETVQQPQDAYEQSVSSNLMELKKYDDTEPHRQSFWARIFRKKSKKHTPQTETAVRNTDVQQTRLVPVINNMNSEADADANVFLPFNTMSAKAGKFGLSGMADNVSEWTATSYYEGGSNFESRFNPDINWGKINSESKYQRRKVVRGGSWKDISRFKSINNRFYNDMLDDHSYIGFRIVVVNLPE